MEEKIYTAKDRAQEMGFASYLNVLEHILQVEISRDVTEENPVNAFVDSGRWIARCDDYCAGTAYVDFDGFFFCPQCKNSEEGGKLRRVIFPENIAEIEAELLKRKVTYPRGMFGTQAAGNAIGFPRSWNPGETIETLAQQREAAEGVSKDELMTEYLRLTEQVRELKAKLGIQED